MAYSTEGTLRFDGETSVSMGASVTSDTIEVGNATIVMVQLYFKTGTSPTGTFVLQTSLNGTDFDDIDDSSQAITDVGTHTWDYFMPGAKYIRAKYTRASGSGTLSGRFFLKGV